MVLAALSAYTSAAIEEKIKETDFKSMVVAQATEKFKIGVKTFSDQLKSVGKSKLIDMCIFLQYSDFVLFVSIFGSQ